MALFTEECLIVPLTDQDGVEITANTELDSVALNKYQHATIVILFSTTLTGDNVLTVERGATDSADTSDATFHYRVGGATFTTATGSDVLAADATSAALTLTAATYQDKMLVLELDADEMGGYDWLTVDFDGAASAGTCTAVAILSNPRYAEAILDTALT